MQLVTRIDATRLDLKNGAVAYENAGKRVVKWRHDHDQDGAPRKGTAKGMSQITLAKRAGVSVGCLQGLETGTRATRQEHLLAIAKAIGLTYEELTSEDPEGAAAIIPDPRGEGLNNEDYVIAHLFHDAHTDVRVQVKTTLERHATEQSTKLPPAVATPADRRSGSGDRRAHDRAASDADVVRHMDQNHANAVHDFIEAMEAPPPPSATPKKKKVE
jgi:transcriptional regulator with XRE-family HTH domain